MSKPATQISPVVEATELAKKSLTILLRNTSKKPVVKAAGADQ